MARKTWHEALLEIKPFVFQIATPDGYGTGFQVVYGNHTPFCAVATAYHVIDDANEWEKPIRLTHHISGESVTLKEEDRVIIPYVANDLAFILFDKTKFKKIEKKEPLLIDPSRFVKEGLDIGWCGFPSIAPQLQLCFFAGHVSSRAIKEMYYLVDGVAINGVSGGPSFYCANDGTVKILGLVSEYKVNRIYGEARPGLVKICSVEPFQEMLKTIHTKEAAEAKAKEEKEKQAEVMKETKPDPDDKNKDGHVE